MRKKVILFIILIICCYCSIVVLTPYSNAHIDRSINNQINHISLELASGADTKLQKQYPEGYVFSNAVFALALIELEDYQHARLIDSCIKKLLSDRAKSTFDADLGLPYGAFYNGWTNFVLKKYIESSLFKHSSIIKEVMIANLKIGHHSRVLNDSLQLFESYKNQIWPADNSMYAASLDTANFRRYKYRLVDYIYTVSDSTELIYHYVEDQPTIRGSSQALLTYLFAEIDLEKGRYYNSIFLSQFESSFLSIDFIKEYKDGHSDEDVDSGPVIFGIGSVATIMNIKTQSAFGNDSRATWAALNLAGIPLNAFGKKRYLFGKEIMFDIFMLWTSIDFLEKEKS